MGPHGEAEIEDEGVGLGEKVSPRRQAEAKASRGAARTGVEHEQQEEHEPRGGESEVVAAARAPRGGETAYGKRAIVEEDEDGRGDHDLLGRHAESAGHEGKGEPRASAQCGHRDVPAHRFGCAGKGVKREKIKETAERFGALRDAGN